MARNETLSLPAGLWVELTNADITEIRVQNTGPFFLDLMATVGPVEPNVTSGALRLGPGHTLAADLALSQLWPGVVGANRVFARSESGTSVSVSHA